MLHISFWQRQNKREGIVCGTNKPTNSTNSRNNIFFAVDFPRYIPKTLCDQQGPGCLESTSSQSTQEKRMTVHLIISRHLHLWSLTRFKSMQWWGPPSCCYIHVTRITRSWRLFGADQAGRGCTTFHADQQLPVAGKISSHQPPAAIRKHYSAAIISNMGSSDLFRETDSICSACGTWMKMNEHEVGLSKMSS